ncbi:MAG TPA: hypothetical protein VLI90_13985 [Tepidisphaeraceae bacterium]|nr:hypothetical protein [Tepidisphaeraceae bacterium]
MNQTAPTTAPVTQPAAPFEPAAGEPDAARPGVIQLSDGATVRGSIATTPEKPVRVWTEEDKEYQDIPLAMIKSIDADVLWERDEREWRFKAGGSDVKEYSGKTYPARETRYKLTLIDGTTITGGIVAPLYVSVDGQTKTLVLHKRDKGNPGQTLAQLLYVKAVRFEDAPHP